MQPRAEKCECLFFIWHGEPSIDLTLNPYVITLKLENRLKNCLSEIHFDIFIEFWNSAAELFGTVSHCFDFIIFMEMVDGVGIVRWKLDHVIS